MMYKALMYRNSMEISTYITKSCVRATLHAHTSRFLNRLAHLSQRLEGQKHDSCPNEQNALLKNAIKQYIPDKLFLYPELSLGRQSLLFSGNQPNLHDCIFRKTNFMPVCASNIAQRPFSTASWQQRASDVYNDASTTAPTQVIDKEKMLRQWKDGIDLNCLRPEHVEIHDAHFSAVQAGKEVYVDPTTGYEVFTILTHLNRAYCCGNVCRHCPYKHSGAPPQYARLMRHNTSFFY